MNPRITERMRGLETMTAATTTTGIGAILTGTALAIIETMGTTARDTTIATIMPAARLLLSSAEPPQERRLELLPEAAGVLPWER